MQVDINEMQFIKDNTKSGMYSIIADRLNEKGIKATRFTVAKDASSINKNSEYDPELIKELREVFTMLTGKSFQNHSK